MLANREAPNGEKLKLAIKTEKSTKGFGFYDVFFKAIRLF